MEQMKDFPGGPVIKNLPANTGDMDMGLILVQEDFTCLNTAKLVCHNH